MNEAEDAKEGGKEDSKHANLESTMVLGNKIGLLDKKRLVSSEEGRQLAKSLGKTVKFTETSAKDGTGVDEAIYEGVRMIRGAKEKDKEERRLLEENTAR